MFGEVVGHKCSVCGTFYETLPEWKCNECFAFPEDILPVTDADGFAEEADYLFEEMGADDGELDGS